MLKLTAFFVVASDKRYEMSFVNPVTSIYLTRYGETKIPAQRQDACRNKHSE